MRKIRLNPIEIREADAFRLQAMRSAHGTVDFLRLVAGVIETRPRGDNRSEGDAICAKTASNLRWLSRELEAVLRDHTEAG